MVVFVVVLVILVILVILVDLEGVYFGVLSRLFIHKMVVGLFF